MDSVREDIDEAISSVEPEAPFTIGGPAMDLPLPGLSVETISQISLPLSPLLADALAAAGEQAPFGRGLETVVDTQVRNCRQIDSAKVAVSSHWTACVASLLDRAAVALHVSGKVTAELYKLVLYQTGGFFRPHKDTEKASGMFATLVIQLPARFTGGELLVRHGTRATKFDFAKYSGDQIHYALFYTDCEHEVRPVTEGNRLCLIYNVLRTQASAPLPALFANDECVTELAAAGRAWEELLQESKETGLPTKLLTKLEHQYTKTNVGFAALKGRDAATVNVLRRTGLFGLGIALVERMQSGSVEYDHESYRKRRRSGWWDDSDEEDEDGGGLHTLSDVFEDDTAVLQWQCDPTITPAIDLRGLSVDYERDSLAEEVDTLFAELPDREEYEGYTGNAGPTAQQWYRSAVLVIWPRKHAFRLSCESDTRAAAAHVGACAAVGNPDASVLLHQLLRHIQSCGKTPSHSGVAELLASATKLNDEQAARVALRMLVGRVRDASSAAAQRAWSRGERQPARAGVASAAAVDALLAALKLFGWATIVEPVSHVIAATPTACLPYLIPFVAQLDEHCAGACHDSGGVSDVSPTSSQMVARRLAKLAATQAAERCDVAVGARVPQVVELGTRAEDGLAARLVADVSNVGATGLVSIVTQCACAGGVVSDAVVEAFASSVVLEANETNGAVAAAARVWEQLLASVPARERLLEAVLAGASASKVRVGQSGGEALQVMVVAETRARFGANQFLRRAVLARVAQLDSVAEPEKRRRFPRATIPGHPKVTAFLRGPDSVFEYGGPGGWFNGIGHARNFGRKHFGWGAKKDYSATAEEGGRGSAAYVVIRKNWELHQRDMSAFRAMQGELKTLRAWLASPGGIASGVIVIED